MTCIKLRVGTGGFARRTGQDGGDRSRGGWTQWICRGQVGDRHESRTGSEEREMLEVR